MFSTKIVALSAAISRCILQIIEEIVSIFDIYHLYITGEIHDKWNQEW